MLQAQVLRCVPVAGAGEAMLGQLELSGSSSSADSLAREGHQDRVAEVRHVMLETASLAQFSPF